MPIRSRWRREQRGAAAALHGGAEYIAALDAPDRRALSAQLGAGSKLVAGADSPRTILALAGDARLDPVLRDLLLAEAHVL